MKLRISDVRSLVRLTLVEGIIDDVKANFQGKEDVVDVLSKNVKPKFLKWAAERVIDDSEPSNEVVHLLKEFEKNSQRLEKKDINSYGSLGELRGAIEAAGISKRKTKALIKSNSEVVGNVVIDDRREIKIIMPKNREAACSYGAGTKWCIAATKSKNYYNDYSSKNVFFYFIIDTNANNPAYMKVAVAISRKNAAGSEDSHIADYENIGIEIFDTHDKKIDSSDLEDEWGENGVRDIFSVIKTDFNSRKDTFEHTIFKETDPEKLVALAKTGMYDELLMQHPKFPHAVYPDMFFRNVKSESDLLEVFSDETSNCIVPSPGMIRTIIEKFGIGEGLAVALELFEDNLPDDLVMLIEASGNTRVRQSLARVRELLPEQIKWLINNGSPATLGSLSNRSDVLKVFWKELLEKNIRPISAKVFNYGVNHLKPDIFLAAKEHVSEGFVKDSLVEIVGLILDTNYENIREDVFNFLKQIDIPISIDMVRTAYYDPDSVKRVSDLLAEVGLLD